MPCCCAPRRSPSSFPFASLALRFYCQPPVRQVPACLIPANNTRMCCSKQKYVLSNLYYARTQGWIKKKKTCTTPPHIYLPWLAGLVTAHTRTCSRVQVLRHLSDRERLPFCSHSRGHSLTDFRLSWVAVAGGYKVKAGMYSGWQVCYSFMTWSEEILYLEL